MSFQDSPNIVEKKLHILQCFQYESILQQFLNGCVNITKKKPSLWCSWLMPPHDI